MYENYIISVWIFKWFVSIALHLSSSANSTLKVIEYIETKFTAIIETVKLGARSILL